MASVGLRANFSLLEREIAAVLPSPISCGGEGADGRTTRLRIPRRSTQKAQRMLDRENRRLWDLRSASDYRARFWGRLSCDWDGTTAGSRCRAWSSRLADEREAVGGSKRTVLDH